MLKVKQLTLEQGTLLELLEEALGTPAEVIHIANTFVFCQAWYKGYRVVCALDDTTVSLFWRSEWIMRGINLFDPQSIKKIKEATQEWCERKNRYE